MTVADENNVVYLHWKHERQSASEKVMQSEFKIFTLLVLLV